MTCHLIRLVIETERTDRSAREEPLKGDLANSWEERVTLLKAVLDQLFSSSRRIFGISVQTILFDKFFRDVNFYQRGRSQKQRSWR